MGGRRAYKSERGPLPKPAVPSKTPLKTSDDSFRKKTSHTSTGHFSFNSCHIPAVFVVELVAVVVVAVVQQQQLLLFRRRI